MRKIAAKIGYLKYSCGTARSFSFKKIKTMDKIKAKIEHTDETNKAVVNGLRKSCNPDISAREYIYVQVAARLYKPLISLFLHPLILFQYDFVLRFVNRNADFMFIVIMPNTNAFF